MSATKVLAHTAQTRTSPAKRTRNDTLCVHAFGVRSMLLLVATAAAAAAAGWMQLLYFSCITDRDKNKRVVFKRTGQKFEIILNFIVQGARTRLTRCLR